MGWLLPLVVFVSFVLGVVLTLALSGSGLEAVRVRLESVAAGDDRLAEAGASFEERLSRLRNALSEIIRSFDGSEASQEEPEEEGDNPGDATGQADGS
jgi:hypothetical protein